MAGALSLSLPPEALANLPACMGMYQAGGVVGAAHTAVQEEAARIPCPIHDMPEKGFIEHLEPSANAQTSQVSSAKALAEDIRNLSLQRMSEAEAEAARNSRLVHAITYQEALAGIFKPPPPEHLANFMGLFLNCVVAGQLLLHCTAHCLHIHVIQ